MNQFAKMNENIENITSDEGMQKTKKYFKRFYVIFFFISNVIGFKCRRKIGSF